MRTHHIPRPFPAKSLLFRPTVWILYISLSHSRPYLVLISTRRKRVCAHLVYSDGTLACTSGSVWHTRKKEAETEKKQKKINQLNLQADGGGVKLAENLLYLKATSRSGFAANFKKGVGGRVLFIFFCRERECAMCAVCALKQVVTDTMVGLLIIWQK